MLCLNRDLRDNPVKCGCEFYHRWKILRSKGVEILGKCIDSQQQSGPSFKNLNNEYFNCGKYTLLCLCCLFSRTQSFLFIFPVFYLCHVILTQPHSMLLVRVNLERQGGFRVHFSMRTFPRTLGVIWRILVISQACLFLKKKMLLMLYIFQKTSNDGKRWY